MIFLTGMTETAASLSMNEAFSQQLAIALVFFLLGYFYGRKQQKKADRKRKTPVKQPKQTMTMAQKQEAKGEKRNRRAAQAASRQPEQKTAAKLAEAPRTAEEAQTEKEPAFWQPVADIPQEASKASPSEPETPKPAEREILWYEDTLQEKPPKPPKPEPETEEDRIGKILGEFSPVESLGLDFQYAFPDNVQFQPGKGYLRNAQNELYPDEETLGSMSRSVAYAMNGLFRVYDVVYRGKLYTFQQIMEREMGEGYVRIQAVAAPALIQESGFYDCYRLVKKGKLEIADA